MANNKLNLIGLSLIIIGIVLIIIGPLSIISNLMVPLGLFLIIFSNFKKVNNLKSKSKNKYFILNLMVIILASGLIMFLLGRILSK